MHALCYARLIEIMDIFFGVDFLSFLKKKYLWGMIIPALVNFEHFCVIPIFSQIA